MYKYSPDILVVGDVMLDHYLIGLTNRISPEAPVPIVNIIEEKWVLGGAANVANNLISIRSNVTLAGIIGKDENGYRLKNIIREKGINDLILESSSRRTTTKSRVISTNQQLVRIDIEDKHSILQVEEIELLEKIKINIKKFDCIILSDYSKGLLTDNLISELIIISNFHNIKVLIDPKLPPFKKYLGSYLIKPNRKEAKMETGIEINSLDSFYSSAKAIQKATLCEVVVITLSEDGVGYLNKESYKILPTKAREIYDVTGAGDTFIATLAYCISIGKSLIESCEIANYASGVVVGKQGCLPIEFEEIEFLL